MEWILLTVIITAQVAGYYWLRAKVESVAREASEKTLADYRKTHAKELEEFSLYAQARYRIYPQIYRQYRKAADRLSAILGVSSRPAFEQYDVHDAREYFKRYGISHSSRSPVEEAFAASSQPNAANLLESLHERVVYGRFMRAFNKAKSAEALNLLYLSDEVQEKVHTLRTAIAKASVEANPRYQPRRTLDEEKEPAMRAALTGLYGVMRSELRRV